MSIKREVDKENVNHRHKINVFSHKESEIITDEGKWMRLGSNRLTKRNILCFLLHVDPTF